jgi:hypothetical protein
LFLGPLARRDGPQRTREKWLKYSHLGVWGQVPDSDSLSFLYKTSVNYPLIQSLGMSTEGSHGQCSSLRETGYGRWSHVLKDQMMLGNKA